MPFMIIKNPDTGCHADAVVKPVYAQTMFGIGKATFLEAPERENWEVQVICPRKFSQRLLRRGYLACIRLAKEKGFSKVTIVTNEFHLYRSCRLAENMGWQVGRIAAPVPKQGLFPLACYLREYCSVLLMYARELI
jgi:hypothetical protein